MVKGPPAHEKYLTKLTMTDRCGGTHARTIAWVVVGLVKITGTYMRCFCIIVFLEVIRSC